MQAEEGGRLTVDATVGGGASEDLAKDPDWFEAGARALEAGDAWGAAAAALAAGVTGPVERYLESFNWTERSVNTTLTCKAAGCSAASSLQAYNPAVEHARNCKLSVFFHPTDFDDQYSGERVRYVKANGMALQADCFPMASGCNTSGMFACARDVPVDSMINAQGSLEISAAISDEVDECPYNGNMLSAIPMLSCLIAERPPGDETEGMQDWPELEDWLTGVLNGTENASDVLAMDPWHRQGEAAAEYAEAAAGAATDAAMRSSVPQPVLPAARPVLPVVPAPEPQPTSLTMSATFRCPTRGCTAAATFRLNQTVLPLGDCFLSIHVNQTDFDDGTSEKIEFIKVNDAVVASDLTPGSNPCHARYLGKNVGHNELVFTALHEEDVTKDVHSAGGHLNLQVKISNLVDECAYEGYLLSGHARLHCSLGTPSSQPQLQAQEHLHLEGLG